MRSHKLSVIASHMINVLVYIALMGFISVLYGIGILCIDEEKLDAVKTNVRRTCGLVYCLEFSSANSHLCRLGVQMCGGRARWRRNDQ